VTHAKLLGFEVFAVVLIGSDDNGYVLHNVKTIAFETYTLYGIVADETNLANAQFAKNLCANAIIALVGLET
jgi:hypothetical protein